MMCWMSGYSCDVGLLLINLFILNLFIYLFMAALGLHCWAQAFPSCGERGLLFVAVRGLMRWLLLLRSMGCRAQAQ